MAPPPIPLPYTLAFPPPSHRDATTPSPCWASHFMTQERIMFSNPTPSEPRLSPAATMSDDTPSALTPPLHCASILHPTTPPQVVALAYVFDKSELVALSAKCSAVSLKLSFNLSTVVSISYCRIFLFMLSNESRLNRSVSSCMI